MFGAWGGISWGARFSITGEFAVGDEGCFFDRRLTNLSLSRWDTTGFMIEHYADGDLVNKDTPIGWMNAGDESLAVWGPEVPKW